MLKTIRRLGELGPKRKELLKKTVYHKIKYLGFGNEFEKIDREMSAIVRDIRFDRLKEV